MSDVNFLRFLTAARDDPALLARYDGFNMAQLIFHAGDDGYRFGVPHIESVVGKLEANVILDKDGEAFDGGSTLWRAMWGRRHLDYVVNHLISRHTDEELAVLVGATAGEAK